MFSGLLTEAGWRWTFLLPVPIALAALVGGIRLIPSDAPAREEGGYDLPGAITGAAAMLLLVYAVVEAPDQGLTSPRTLMEFAAVVALIALFIAIERRTRHPLVRLGILRSGSLTRANLGAIAFFGGYVAFQFVVMLYLQSVLGWSAMQTALGFLPTALIVAFGSPRISPIVDRFGSQLTVAAGVVAHVAGYALFLRVDETSSYVTSVLPSMILLGIGFMLTFPSLNIQATQGVDDSEQGLASGLLNTSVQVGGAVVLAIVTAVITANGGAEASAPALLAGLTPTLIVVTGLAARRRHPRRPTNPNQPPSANDPWLPPASGAGEATSVHKRQICLGKVIANEQQWLPGSARHRIGEAVTKIQPCWMPALAETLKRCDGNAPVGFGQRHNLDPSLVEEPRQERFPDRAQTRSQNDPRLGYCRRTDLQLQASREALQKSLMTVFLQENRDDRGAIDDHTPSGP